MLNLDPAKLLVIFVIAFVVLGPERLPRVARQLGAAWRELTRIRSEVSEEVRNAFSVDHVPKIPNTSAAVSSFVSGFTNPLKTVLGGTTTTTAPNAAPEEAASGADEGASAADATAVDLDETAAPIPPSQTPPPRPISTAGAPPAGEDWSALAHDPSMN